MSGWRFLVDEDTDVDTARELSDRGYDAATVAEEVGEGTADPVVAERARTGNRILITTDRDFLDGELYPEVQVLLVTDSRATGHEIAESVEQVVGFTDGPTELRRVTWL